MEKPLVSCEVCGLLLQSMMSERCERRGHGSAVGRGERTARWIVPVHGDRDSGKSSLGICLQRCCTEFTYRATSVAYRAGNEKMENGKEHYVITSSSRFPNSAKTRNTACRNLSHPASPRHTACMIITGSVQSLKRVQCKCHPRIIHFFYLLISTAKKRIPIPLFHAFLLDYTTLLNT